MLMWRPFSFKYIFVGYIGSKEHPAVHLRVLPAFPGQPFLSCWPGTTAYAMPITLLSPML